MSTNINRRSFLGKAAAASAVGVIGMSALSACKKKLSNEELGLPPLKDRAPDGPKLRAGLVGCGNRGTGAALNFMDAGPNLEIVALADVFMDKVLDSKRKLKEHNVRS